MAFHEPCAGESGCNPTIAVWPLLLALALVACEAPKRAVDYRDANPNVVGKETHLLTIRVPPSGVALADRDAGGLERFLRVYLERGQGPVMAETPAVSGLRVRELLIGAGLRSPEIVIRSADTGASSQGAVLTFVANTVKVPECEDWSSKSTYNWTNRRHSNFGCATQRNIGLTVANPGDLAKPRTLSHRAAPQANHIIYNYTPEAGQPAGGRGVGSPDLRTGGSAAKSTEGATEGTPGGS